MRLLVTRPESDATRTAQAARAGGHQVLIAPLLRVETIACEFDGPFAAVLLTSANAARAVAAHPRRAELVRMPAFAVGARTAEAAREAGFTLVESADGALGALVQLTVARLRGGRLLYLAGADRAGDLAGDLAAHGFTVDTAVIYRAVTAETLPAAAAAALAAGEIDAALHYSRRSTLTLLRLAERERLLNAVLSLAHYALSEDVAAVLREAGAGRVRAAAVPTESALFDLI